jgi:hypothetical protein
MHLSLGRSLAGAACSGEVKIPAATYIMTRLMHGL